jgi:hypothetical protein
VSVERLLERLHNAKAVHNGQWVAGCPLCQSRKGRPVAIKAFEDGRILIHPFCGCETGDIVKALGLRMADLFPPKPSNHYSAPVRRGFDAALVLEALAHEFCVAALIACDVDAAGAFSPDQRERMHLVATRVMNGVKMMGIDRVTKDFRRLRQRAAEVKP